MTIFIICCVVHNFVVGGPVFLSGCIKRAGEFRKFRNYFNIHARNLVQRKQEQSIRYHMDNVL